MNDTVRTRHQLGVVAEETTAWETDTGVKGDVVYGLLLRECLASVGGLADKIIHFRAERITAVVIPADVHAATRRGRGPCKKVMLLVVEGIVVHAHNAGSIARAHADRGKVDARRRLHFPVADLICRECTIRRGAVNGASRRLCPVVPESPVQVSQSVEHKTNCRLPGDHPGAADECGFPHIDSREIREVIKKDVWRARRVDHHARELRVDQRATYKRGGREGQPWSR